MADQPPSGASRRPFLDAAEPLSAWRVDLAVLLGVSDDWRREPGRRGLSTAREPG
jgi:hypothetical protein